MADQLGSSGVSLGLLGGFTLTVKGVPVTLPATAQRLLALLALRGRPLCRTRVCGALWPDAPANRANASLRSTLWRTHRLCAGAVDTTGNDLALDPAVGVDLHSAQRRAGRLLDGRVRSEEVLDGQTREYLSTPLLPGWYDDDWVVVEREYYDQLRLNALEAMCARLTAAHRYGEAVEAGLSAVRAEPLRESAHERLIRTHLAAGNRWEAIRQYERCRRVLDAELGLAPSPRLAALLPDCRRVVPMRRAVAGRAG
jgi:DNA-binding SARP family transcriptional activator